MRKFKFFEGQSLNLPDQGRFNHLVNHQPQVRFTYMYRSSIPMNQIPDYIYDQIIQDSEYRLRNDALVPMNTPVQHQVIYSGEDGFTIRFEIIF